MALAAAAVAVAAAAAAVAFVNRTPDDWPQRDEFCDQAAALEVGAVGFEAPGEKAEVLAALAETAPDELADEFEGILHANEHDDRAMVDEEHVTTVGVFIEETCGVNLPGVTT
jgi:hypothetical protein